MGTVLNDAPLCSYGAKTFAIAPSWADSLMNAWSKVAKDPGYWNRQEAAYRQSRVHLDAM